GGDRGEEAAPTDMSAMLSELEADSERHGHRATVAFHGQPTVTVRPAAFKRCLTNLVSNAGRFASTVAITGHRDHRWLTVTIDDDGPGIPAQLREDVFKPFLRLDDARNQDEGGTGLGLAIARDIARSHGGDITLGDSPLGGVRATGRGLVWSAEDRRALSLPLDVGRGAGENLHKPRLGIGVAFKTLADRLAQMVEGGFGQRRQGTAFAALTAEVPPPTVDAFAECAQPVEHSVDNLAIGIEIDTAFVGDRVKLLRPFSRSRDVAGFLQISERRIDDAGAGAVPVGGLLFEQLDDFIAVAGGLGDQRQRDETQVALGQHTFGAHPVLG